MPRNKQNKKNNFRQIILKFLFLVLFLFVFLAVLRYSARALMSLDFFKIKEILIKENKIPLDISYLKARNIFSIDIARESDYISGSYPTFRRVRLIRVLPNYLYVDFLTRKPLAYIRLYRTFCIDQEMILYDCPPELSDPDLPVISGLETKIFGPKAGNRYNIEELKAALGIIEAIGNNRVLRDYSMKKVDVQNLENVSFFLVQKENTPQSPASYSFSQGVIEVRISNQYITERVGILAGVLSQLRRKPAKIKYIDLRFKEPVIKFDDKK